MKISLLNANDAEIFHECAALVQTGQATIAECAAKYPQFVGLEKMLRTALTMQQIDPSPMAADRKSQLAQTLMEKVSGYYPQPIQSTTSSSWRTSWRTWFLTLPATAVAIILIVTFGYALSSQNSFSGHQPQNPPSLPAAAPTQMIDTQESATTEAVNNATDTALENIATREPNTALTLDDLKTMTQNCVTNKRYYTSFQTKIEKGQWQAFINEVKAQAGKKLKSSCADDLISAAKALMLP